MVFFLFYFYFYYIFSYSLDHYFYHHVVKSSHFPPTDKIIFFLPFLFLLFSLTPPHIALDKLIKPFLTIDSIYFDKKIHMPTYKILFNLLIILKICKFSSKIFFCSFLIFFFLILIVAFNKPVNNLPASLYSLTISNGSFNQEIHTLPANLQILYLQSDLLELSSLDFIPPKLKHLDLDAGLKIGHGAAIHNLPHTLHHLRLKCGSLHEPFPILALPPNLVSLELSGKYNPPNLDIILPAKLKSLHLDGDLLHYPLKCLFFSFLSHPPPAIPHCPSLLHPPPLSLSSLHCLYLCSPLPLSILALPSISQISSHPAFLAFSLLPSPLLSLSSLSHLFFFIFHFPIPLHLSDILYIPLLTLPFIALSLSIYIFRPSLLSAEPLGPYS